VLKWHKLRHGTLENFRTPRVHQGQAA